MPKDRDDPLDDSPTGLARRWCAELEASKKDQEKWKKRAKEVLKRYLDDREGNESDEKRLNLFYSDIQIEMASLYGKLPKVEVNRRFADHADEDARIAADMLGRMLNSDIEKGSDTYASALMNNLEDWRVVGFAIAKLRYSAEFEQVQEVPAQIDPMTGIELAPAVPAHERKAREEVGVDYLNWDDVRWSPCKTWENARWIAYKIPMGRRDLIKTFGEKLGKAIPLDENKGSDDKDRDEHERDPSARACIWEIWCKEGWSDEHPGKKRYFLSESYPTILKVDDDPLGLDGFFPSPKPLAANTTTSRYMPVPDYYFAQDLYRGCDELYNRICLLERAIAVRGVYDAGSPELKQLLSHTAENKMLPAKNFSALAEKGGFKGVIDFVPLDMIAATIDKLTQKLQEKIQLLFQATGKADIMRGAAANDATATEQAIKAEYGSIRTKYKQGEFSRYATEILQLKGEIISKHFDPETIVRYSNAGFTADAQRALNAAQLLKDEFHCYRIVVKPEEIGMPDLAAIKNERLQLLQAMGQIFGQIAAMAKEAPELVPALLEQAKEAIAAFKGSSNSETAIDQGIGAWEQKLQMQAMQPPQPDPKVAAAQMKAEGDKAKMQSDHAKVGAELQADLMRTQAQLQADLQVQNAQAKAGIAEKLIDAQIKRATDRVKGPNE